MIKIMAGFLATLAGSPAAQVDDSSKAASRVMGAIGATLVRRSRLVCFLRHPLVGEGLTVYCGPAGVSVSMRWSGCYPPTSFFRLVAQAGSAITDDLDWVIEHTLLKCYRYALEGITAAEPNVHADGGVGQAEIECDIHSHDSGGCTLTVSRRG